MYQFEALNVKGRCGVGDLSCGTLTPQSPTQFPSLHLRDYLTKSASWRGMWQQRVHLLCGVTAAAEEVEESCQGLLPVKFARQNGWCIRLSHAVTFPFCQFSSHLQGFHNFAATYPFKGLSLSQLSSECRSREMNGFVERVRFPDFLQKQDREHSQPLQHSLPPLPLTDFQGSIPPVRLPLYLDQEGGLTLFSIVSTMGFYLWVARRRMWNLEAMDNWW